MKRFLLFTSALILCNSGICQNNNTLRPASFNIHSKTPFIKTAFSESNSLFVGSNALLLKGIDSADTGTYYLKCPTAALYKANGMYYINISDTNFRYMDTSKGPHVASYNKHASLQILIYKIHSGDTIYIGSQELKSYMGNIPPFYVKVNGYANGASISTKLLLQCRKLNLTLDPYAILVTDTTDFCKEFRIASFHIKMCNKDCYCSSDTLTDELVDAINNCSPNFVAIDNITVIGPDNIPFPLSAHDNYPLAFISYSIEQPLKN